MKKMSLIKSKKLRAITFLTLMALIFSNFGAMLNVIAADNDALQEASTSKASTISIVSKVSDSAITSITFPQGAPGATISNPYNNVDTDSDSQLLDDASSEPVVRLKNNHSGTLNVWLEISDWTNGVVASENYELVATNTTNIEAVSSILSSNGLTASVDTSVSIPTTEYKALYLQLVLSGVADAIGSSTITILGES